MIFAAGRNGLIGLLIFVAVIYYSGAGGWMLNQLKHLDTACFSAMSSSQWSSPYAEPVCGAVAKGSSAVDRLASGIGDVMVKWRENLMGSNVQKLDNYTNALRDRLSGLSSAQSQLDQMINVGPKFSGQAIPTAEQFQQAVDSFAIGQLYMKDSATIAQALQWLQNGAAQPQGFGVASQMTLGNLYAQGGQGLEQNPQLATAYLQQAKQSIATLSSSNTAQSQQLLKTLPAPPDVMMKQLEQAIRGIQAQTRR